MRKFTPSSLIRAQLLPQRTDSTPAALFAIPRLFLLPAQQRSLAAIHDRDYLGPEICFSSTVPCPLPAEGPGSGLDYKPPDERTLKLGKSRSILLLEA